VCGYRSCKGTTENGIPKVPDGLVQFADGVVDLIGPTVIADQSQRRVEVQSCGEQPVNHDIVQAPGNPVVIFDYVPGRLR